MKYISTTVLIAALLLATASSRGALAQPAPYELNVLMGVTGTMAFIGSQQQASLKALEAAVNRTGGIRGRPLKLVFYDDESNIQSGVQLASEMIAKHIPVLLGPGSTQECEAVDPLVRDNGPVTMCFTPGLHPKQFGYLFANAPSVEDLTAPVLRFYRERNLKRVALLISNDVIGQLFEKRFDFLLAQPEFKDMDVVTRERFNPTDINIAAQVARIKAVKADWIAVSTFGTPFGTVLRSMRDGGLDIPVNASGANMNYGMMAAYADFLPTELTFAASRGFIPEPSLTGPVRKAQDFYFSALKTANLRSQTQTFLPWDMTMLVISGLRELGTDVTAQRLHDWIEHQKAWVGAAGYYNFTTGDQLGIGQAGSSVLRWDPIKADFVIVYPRR